MNEELGNFWQRLFRRKNSKRSERELKAAGHRLNVRVDSKKARRVRRQRTAKQSLKIAGGVLGLIVVVTAAKAVVSKVYYENPQFELGRLYIETDGDLTRPVILKHSGIQRHDNLLDLDLSLVRAKLAALPQVAEVRVEKQLPDIISIRVRERLPIAWLECPEAGARPHTPDGGWLIDARGNAFPCEGLADEHMELPIIVIDDLPPLIGRVKIESGRLVHALRLVELNHDRFYDEQLEILRIDCARDYSMIVHYRNDASVVFGSTDLPGQFHDFAAILSYAKGEGLQIASLNLMIGENKPVTFYTSPTGWEEAQFSSVVPAQGGEITPQESPPASPSYGSTGGHGSDLPVASLVPVVEPEPAPQPVSQAESDVRAILGSLY